MAGDQIYADEVVSAFIGLRGVASTEIAFVSTRGKGPEIYVMGADGATTMTTEATEQAASLNCLT